MIVDKKSLPLILDLENEINALENFSKCDWAKNMSLPYNMNQEKQGYLLGWEKNVEIYLISK